MLTYLGDAAAWKQITPPSWNITYAGQSDTCSIQYQGPQVLEKAFLDALTPFQTMVTIAGLSVIDERGNSKGDSHMWLESAVSDDKPVMPIVTLNFKGCRGGNTSEKIPEDQITVQSVSTSTAITDSSSPNYQCIVTMSFQYYAARTSYEWTQLTNPNGTPTYATVRQPLSYSGPYGDSKIWNRKFSGMVDDAGDPTTAISTGDATEVWNSLSDGTVVSSFTARETVPGKVWECKSDAEYTLVGN